MKTTKVVLSLAAAAVAGAAIGMLLAPEKGADLQKRIKDGAQQWMDEIAKLLKTGRELADGARATAAEGLEDMQSNLKRIE